MLTKKICLLGASGVGKTSLVSRFVHQIFSEKYLTTIGVKVDKKELTVNGQPMKLMIWDLAGEDEFEQLQLKYTRGAHGCLVVVDGTRRHTFDTAMGIHQRLVEQNGPLPCHFLFNKSDLADEWIITPDETGAVESLGFQWHETSAKEDRNVEAGFVALASRLLRS